MSTMAALSGILINTAYMDIISNNIANAATMGYKSKRPIFFDMFTHSFYSKNNYGYGVGISHIMPNFNNGMLIETGRDLDIGILNDGLFRLVDNKGNVHYTRNGEFLVDANDNLVSMNGFYLTGKNQSSSTDAVNDESNLEPINFKKARILKKKSTSEIKLKTILNRNSDISTNSDNSDAELSHIQNDVKSINIYNKDGEKEKLNISFNKKEKNHWTINVTSNDSPNDNEKSINKSFDLTFNSDGEITSNKSFVIEPKDSKKYENITLDLTDTTEQADTNEFSEQFSQNGYSQGRLQSYSIASNGDISAKYSNKQEQKVGQILLAHFVNPEKLEPESGNLWTATVESGKEEIGIINNQNLNILHHRALETSNVDLNKELINMIVAQRNYQSNAQSFKAEDKIINTLINLR